MSFYHPHDGSVVPILSTNSSEDALRKRRNDSLKPFIQQQQQIFIPDMIPQHSSVATASSHNLRKSTHSDVSMKPTRTTTSLQIWSHHVERIKLLLRHLFPNLMNRESTRMSENGFESTKKIETEDYYCSSNVKAFPSCCCCTYLLLVGNTGDMSACSDLSICNAIKDYSHNFEKYSRCIINVHNDLFHFLYFVKNVEKMYGDKLDVMDLTYNMICNYEYQKTKELMKFFNGKNYERSLKCMKEHSVLSLNIIYWSGHGENNLGLSFPSFQYMSFEEFLSIFANQNSESISIPHLFVMECCFSNEKEIFNFVQKTRHHNKPFPYLFLCSSIEKSGGWICDGVDSNGIMTNFLTDPVSSFFKVKYKIFFDLGNNSSEYFPYFNAKVKRKFYSIIDTCLSEVFSLVYPVEFVNFVGAHLSFLHSSMIRLLFKHFILLHYYVDKLYQRQTPFSYPPISTHVLRDLKVVTLISQMEDNIDSLLIDTFRNTQI